MNLKENPEAQKFLHSMVEQVSFKPAHEEIKLEYLTHLEESVSLGVSYGLTLEAATSEAIRRMGSPVEIGLNLNRIHAPKIDLAIVLSTVCLCLIGIYTLAGKGFGLSQTAWVALGLIGAAIFTFTSSMKLIRASPYLYVLSFALLAISHITGISESGQPYLVLGPLKLKIVDLSTVLFLVSIAGLTFRVSEKFKWRPQVLIVLSMLPLTYFASIQSVFPGFLFFTSAITVFVSARFTWRSLAAFTTASILILSAAISPKIFLTAEGFTSLQTTEAHTDFIFHYMLSNQSWLAIVTLLAFGLLISRLVVRATDIKNRFCSAIFNASLVLIVMGALCGIAGGLGFIPMPQTGVNLPFISYGGSLMTAHLALIGIILGSIRRRTLHLN